MVNPIAIPRGLYWINGFGITLMDPLNAKPDPLQPAGAAGIRQDIFKANGCRVIFGLDIQKGDFTPSTDNMIIDCRYDGILIEDPHSQTPGQFIADYPSQTDRGPWLNSFMPKQNPALSAPGDHRVDISTAPRKIAQTVRTRDFSAEAGGVTRSFILRILPPPPGYGRD